MHITFKRAYAGADTGFRKGGGGGVRATFLSLFMKFGVPQKGDSLLTLDITLGLCQNYDGGHMVSPSRFIAFFDRLKSELPYNSMRVLYLHVCHTVNS